MTEYRDVERPFLDQLKTLGWRIIDQGTGSGEPPQDPAASERDSFREVVLADRFKEAVRHINRTDDGLIGDVDFDGVIDKVKAITPVPGGVGPMTIASLLENTLTACKERRGLGN